MSISKCEKVLKALKDIKILKEKYFKVKHFDNGILINLAWHISNEIRNYLRRKMKFKGKIIDIISNSDFK